MISVTEKKNDDYGAFRKAAGGRNAVWHAVDGLDDPAVALCGATTRTMWVYGGTLGELLSCQRCRRKLDALTTAEGSKS